MKSFKTPTAKQIEEAVQRIMSPDHAVYFFSGLKNPEWVSPLNERGLFANSPPAHWPASKYLVRMTKYKPFEVASIYSKLDTENPSVLGDMLAAALLMPPKIAATLVPKLSSVFQTLTFLPLLKDASSLCVSLAEGGEVSSAMTLVEVLFKPRFEGGQEYPDRNDEYWYKAGLEKVVPALVAKEPSKFLLSFCEWLKVLVDAKEHVDLKSGSDSSFIWRPAIEEHEQNRDYEIASVLVGFLRQGFEQAIREVKVSLADTLKIIGRYSYLIFQRMRIHLINEFAEQDSDLARQTMMDRKLFDDQGYKHEYAMLVGKRLSLLTGKERATWFKWIDDGPDMSGFESSIKRKQGREPTNEERKSRKQYWQFEKFHCVREHLANSEKQFYKRMLEKHGEPELADLNIKMGPGQWGSESPMTIDDLSKQTFETVVETVSSWKPDEAQRFMGPNIEGLATTFGGYIATNLKEFSSKADVMIGRPAIYVRGFINQMSEAVNAKGEIDIAAVLELCRWVIERPLEERTISEEEDDENGFVDKDWQWTRDTISRFLQNICEAKKGDGPSPRYTLKEFRDPLWRLIKELCQDRAKSYVVHDTSSDDPRLRDYLDLGINSPRGKAVEVALEYARWVANQIKETVEGRETIPGAFEAMPEVRDMLEWQIKLENRSHEALAIIGSRLSLIYWIDKNWLASNAEMLFRLNGIELSPPIVDGWAAWNSFLVWNRPHIEFYRIFKSQFAYAVNESAKINPEKFKNEIPMNHLGEHLMILYGRGQLKIEDDDGLIGKFLSNSHPEIRIHSIGFVGRSVERKEDVPEDVIDRFKNLWERYWSESGKADAGKKPDAWLFGIWFASGKFPIEWSLIQLEDFVSVTKNAEPDHLVVGQLSILAETNPLKTVRILELLIRGDREGWRIHGWLDSAKQILNTAIKEGGEARAKAELIIDYLGRRGYSELGALLQR